MITALRRPYLGLRATARLSMLAWVALTAAAGLLLRATHRRDLRTRARWLQLTCQRALHALNVTSVNRGAVPTEGIVVANHLGYLDVLVLAAAAPTVFVAKHEVAGWPLFGWFARMAGTRFIDRERRGDVARVAAELAPALAQGVRIVLFLEGTSSDGHGVLPFKSSLLEPATRNNWPAIPAALAFEVPPNRSAANEVCWWGDMTLVSHLWNLATLPWIRACTAYGEPRRGHERKRLALVLHASCMDLLANLAERARRRASTPRLLHEEQLTVAACR